MSISKNARKSNRQYLSRTAWEKHVADFQVEADFLKPDNNEVERIMRTAAIGRRNYLFTGSERGSEAIATFYSLTESAKAYQLNVLHYLTDVVEQLPNRKTTEAYLALTPNRWKPANS